MAYTSALFGLRIDNHPEYLSLLEEYQDAAYPDLGRYLQSQGYYSLFVSSIAKELRESDLEQYLNFYGVDDWLTYGRLDYQGPRYGWGPAPPDQYVLWHVEKEVAATLDQPKFIFTITQNSHYPWVPQPEVVDDWQTLNLPAEDPSAPLPDQIPSQAKRRNYMNAIDYQLRFLTDFILKNGRDNAVYVLIGDHQPQQVSRREDGFETPIHIISRDADFADLFQEYGFVDGLILEDIAPSLRHEGLYSLLVRTLLTSYGKAGSVLPDYLPDGIVLDLPDTGNE
jgi:phosphoglycerol transferase MdoB-like AlkP superfamily enzyme